MAKNLISLRLDEWMRKDIISLASARDIPPTTLIREFIEKGLDHQNQLVDQFSLDSEKTERQLKLITEAVLGTLYTVVALRDQSASPSPDVEMCRKAVAAGSKAAQEFLSIQVGDE
ncbi:hypothetical protein D521_0450 [beta proteobacterium CB]|nr:hypothetical protein D521_0450 [beta proteobacterium CB]